MNLVRRNTSVNRARVRVLPIDLSFRTSTLEEARRRDTIANEFMISDFWVSLSLDNTLALAAEVRHCCFHFHPSHPRSEKKSPVHDFFFFLFFFLKRPYVYCSYNCTKRTQVFYNLFERECTGIFIFYFYIFDLYFRFSFPSSSFFSSVINE